VTEPTAGDASEGPPAKQGATAGEGAPATDGSPVAVTSEGATAGEGAPTGDGAPAGEGTPTTGGSTGGRTAVAVALRELAPPRHDRSFWPDLDRRLADEPQLRLAPRSAIRPITQPPPVIDDSSLAGRLKGDPLPPARRRSRRTLLAVVAAVLVALVALLALESPDENLATGPGDSAETTGGRTPTTDPADAEEEPPAETTPPTAPPGTVEPEATLGPGGVGPLRIGMTLGELQMSGVVLQVDQATYEGSGHSCYDAQVRGALDLELRFRPPDGLSQVDDATQGVLASIAIEMARPTVRTSDTGLALGVPQDQVLATYAGNLDERPHPFASGGSVFRADNGDGTGISYRTDGQSVIGIAVGYMDIIRFINQCR
jgi:hypothetical protein